jgi:Nitroreductase family
MIKGSEVRKADFLIEPLLLDRWLPRAISGEEISREELIRLFEAARWAPSSFNAQQWRALYARRGTEHWQTFFNLLVEGNKVRQRTRRPSWCSSRGRRLIRITNRRSRILTTLGQPGRILSLQGFRQGLVVHGMQGFDYERARKELHIPDEFQVEAMAAVGKPGPKELLPEKLRARESPNDRRKLSQSVFEGPFKPD